LSVDDAVTVSAAGAGVVQTLTLNRPTKLNALTRQTFVELRAHLGEFAESPDVRCLVLQGSGRAFCAGLDLDGIVAGHDVEMLTYAAETIDLLENFPVPTVARIHGYCLTGGLELALACDLLVCSDDARLGDTHGKWGLVPAWGMSVRLPARIGFARAKELTFSARPVSGTVAAQIGLVNVSVPAEDLDGYVAELTADIVGNSAESNRINKALYRSSVGSSWSEQLAFERSHPFGRPSDTDQRIQRAGR
jgi:enoyl-CoA hydratase/carnithine racemase